MEGKIEDKARKRTVRCSVEPICVGNPEVDAAGSVVCVKVDRRELRKRGPDGRWLPKEDEAACVKAVEAPGCACGSVSENVGERSRQEDSVVRMFDGCGVIDDGVKGVWEYVRVFRRRNGELTGGRCVFDYLTCVFCESGETGRRYEVDSVLIDRDSVCVDFVSGLSGDRANVMMRFSGLSKVNEPNGVSNMMFWEDLVEVERTVTTRND